MLNLVYGLRFTVYGFLNLMLTACCPPLTMVLFSPLNLASQSAEYRLIKTIPLTATILASDKLGNCYVVNDKQELLKISPAGEPLYTFTNKSLGRISWVGTTNPLKILVYYPDYSTIITLDNTLSQTGRINLFERGINQVSAAAIALDNNIWIFDAVVFKLRKIDDKMNVLAESEDLSALLGKTIRGSFLLEKDNFIFLSDPDTGILVFDTYGTFYKIIPLKGLSSFQKVQDQLVYFKDGSLLSYHLLTFKTETITLPGADAVNAVVEKNRLFILRKKQLDIFSY